MFLSNKLKMIISGRWCACMDTILTPEECAFYIKQLDVSGELSKVERSYYATYSRNMLIDSTLASKIYSRIKHLLPSDVKTVGCNDHFRFSKYEPGEEFKMHRDGINQDSAGNRARYTVNIFLSDEFVGGETEFFDESKKSQFVAVPAIGRGMIFDNQILHSGNKVTSGYKYLLRTDVMV